MNIYEIKSQNEAGWFGAGSLTEAIAQYWAWLRDEYSDLYDEELEIYRRK